jgi:cytidylate kinase
VTATGEVDGVLITGVYGTGKSSTAAEIAETLERRGVSYGSTTRSASASRISRSPTWAPIQTVAHRIIDWLGWTT